MSDPKVLLSELIKTVEAELQRLNYSPSCISGFRCRWRKLLQYAQEKGEQFLSVQLGEQFLPDKYDIDVTKSNTEQALPCIKVKAIKRHIYLLLDFQNTGVVTRKARTQRVEIPSGFIEPVEHYIAACHQRYHSQKTIDARMFTVKAFLLYLDQKQVDKIGAINGATFRASQKQ